MGAFFFDFECIRTRFGHCVGTLEVGLDLLREPRTDRGQFLISTGIFLRRRPEQLFSSPFGHDHNRMTLLVHHSLQMRQGIFQHDGHFGHQA